MFIDGFAAGVIATLILMVILIAIRGYLDDRNR